LRTHGVLITEGRKERKGVEGKETLIPDDFSVSERVIEWANKNKYYKLHGFCNP
jgi:hypothetical protein